MWLGANGPIEVQCDGNAALWYHPRPGVTANTCEQGGGMAIDSALVDIVRKGVDARANVPSPDPFPRVLRVEIEPIEHLTYRVRPTAEPHF